MNNMVAPISKLKAFINSGGSYVPDDILEYQEGEMFESRCPLCDQPHENYHVIWFTPEYETEEVKTYLCKSCKYEDDMIHDPSMFDTSVSIKCSQRYDRIMEEGVMPPDCIEYSDTPEVCYRCDGHVPADFREEVNIPVGYTTKNYGKVSVCSDTCYHTLNEAEYKYRDDCSLCFSPYELTKEEYEIRSNGGTLNCHFCPDCWVSTGHDPDESRFHHWECSSCSKTYVTDKSNAMSDVRPLTDPYPTCLKCRVKVNKATQHIAGMPSSFSPTWRHHWVRVTDRYGFYSKTDTAKGKGWRFEITEDGQTIFKSSYKKLYENVEDCSAIATQVIYSILETKQLELFKNENNRKSSENTEGKWSFFKWIFDPFFEMWRDFVTTEVQTRPS